MSFSEIVDTLNRQGHNFSYTQVPKEVYAGLFPGAAEIAETFDYFQAHTYLGSDSRDQNRARQQNSRPATDQVLGVGSNKFPGPKERPVSSTLIENARKSIVAGADEPSLRGRS